MTAVNEGRKGVQGGGKGPGKVGGAKVDEGSGHKELLALKGFEEKVNGLENAVCFDSGDQGKRLGDCQQGKKDDIKGVNRVGHP